VFHQLQLSEDDHIILFVKQPPPATPTPTVPAASAPTGQQQASPPIAQQFNPVDVENMIRDILAVSVFSPVFFLFLPFFVFCASISVVQQLLGYSAKHDSASCACRKGSGSSRKCVGTACHDSSGAVWSSCSSSGSGRPQGTIAVRSV
jgi:hypothetical protein